MEESKKFSIKEILIMGVAAHENRDLETAFSYYKVILDKVPGHPDANHNLGLLAIDMGKPDAAAPLIEDAINSNPKCKQYWISLLSVYKRQNLTNEYRYTVARIRLEFSEDGEFLETVRRDLESFDSPLTSKEDSTKWKQVGKKLFEDGDYEQLATLLADAVYADPKDANAWINLGLCYEAQGHRLKAIINLKYGLDIDPTPLNYRYLGGLLSNVVLNKPVAGLSTHVLSLLEHKSLVQPKSIVPAVFSLLKFQNNFNDFLRLGNMAYDQKTAVQNAVKITDEPLFIKLLKLCPIPDAGVEMALKNVRRALLEIVNDGLSVTNLYPLISALGTQCFVNEYIYSQTDHETLLVVKLKSKIERHLKKGLQPPNDALLCLACYVRITELQWVENLKPNKTISPIFELQVTNPKIEEDTKDKVLSLFDSENEVSKNVRRQYEKYPYPRWIQLGYSISPLTLKQSIMKMGLNIRKKEILDVLNPKILIAGCGTGQHSIMTAKRYKNSNVTAIDLSIASIAYAKRKTDELSVTNIDYLHCDILQAQKLKESLDLIETVGVLHHMEDPIKGWRALLKTLRPGGLMKIGLYSDLARQHIVEIRNEIETNHASAAVDKIQELRATILSSDKDHHKKIKSSPDFYSLSEVIDLLLHAQEHRFCIPQLKDILDKLNLEFCGFEDTQINRRFKMQYPNRADLVDLDKWHKFEIAYPDTFARMYQFWCQKID